MAGAALFGLEGELNPGGSDGFLDAFRFVADDANDAICGCDGLGGGYDVKQQRAAADFV